MTDYALKDRGVDYAILSTTSEYSIEDYKKLLNVMSFGLYKANIHKVQEN